MGYGHVGYQVARLLRGFECRLRVYDPYLRPHLLEGLDITAAASLQDLLESSELVSLHALVTDETVDLIGARQLGWLGPDGLLVNTARAELVDERALLVALRDGLIKGAALDVFSEEPLPLDHELRRLDNVTLTPHLAGSSGDAPVIAVRLLATRLRRVTPPELWAERSSPEPVATVNRAM